MAGNWRFNAILGLSALLFTYFFSFVNNTWQTSTLRAGIGFLVFFVVGYFLRVVLYQLVSKKSAGNSKKQNLDNNSTEMVERIIQEEENGPVDEHLFLSLPLHAIHKGEVK